MKKGYIHSQNLTIMCEAYQHLHKIVITRFSSVYSHVLYHLQEACRKPHFQRTSLYAITLYFVLLSLYTCSNILRPTHALYSICNHCNHVFVIHSFHMISCRPYWWTEIKKWRPCWWTQIILRELNEINMAAGHVNENYL